MFNEYHGWENISNRWEPWRYIAVHYTGSGSPTPGTALANCQYFSGGNRNASANYFIDDSGIWEYANPDDFYTWHCGDGGGRFGITNSNAIGIEVCQNGDNPFTETEIGYLTELVTTLMAKYNISADNVVRHFDASRKQCPYYYAIRHDAWFALRDRITSGVTLTKEEISEAILSFEIDGVQARDRIQGIDIAINKIKEYLESLDDPTGRGLQNTYASQLKWNGKVLNEILENINKVKEYANA